MTTKKSSKVVKKKGCDVTSSLYRGAPTVSLSLDDTVAVRLNLNKSLSKKILKGSSKGPVSISLESLDLDLQNNQSYGMTKASTGCISNPGGPSC